ncbi:hypothetical protein, partial [Streptomyces sp. SID3343]|uniref:hypothetical protein n=1 Tax=Streptomyces sp. SID3343 TaxID=2690260 RepID=UPI0013C006CE
AHADADRADADAPVWIAFVARDRADLRIKLTVARAGAVDPNGEVFHRASDEAETPPLVGFLYPGQGSQRPGMLADLFARFPALRDGLRTAPAECVRA